MIRGEEIDLREGLVYDPYVKRFDSSFWQGDTANLLFDSVKNAIKIGDTGLVGAASSFSQYLYGDFEFSIALDSLSPDSNDSSKFFGLMNQGDTIRRGAVYFDFSYDTTVGDSSPNARPFSIVTISEAGTRQRKHITWDTLWGGADTIATRYRIGWEGGGVNFLVNDTVVGVLGDRPAGQTATNQINASIPQGLRLVNRSLDTTDTSVTRLKYLAIRHARKII